MTVRYQVPVSAEALAGFLPPAIHEVEGLRFVRCDGAWDARPDVILCTFEDDLAPASLEGQVVHLGLGVEDGPPRRVFVMSRSLIAARPGPD